MPALASCDFKSWRLDFDSLAERRSNLDPPGYDATQSREVVRVESSQRKPDAAAIARRQEAMIQRAWAPLKQVGVMCAVLMFAMGNSIQIWTIFMLVPNILGPVSAIMKSAEMFPKDPEGKVDIFLPRLIYCAIHAGQVAVAAYKLHMMGLLPTHPSDWLSSLPVPTSQEFSYPAM